MELASARASRPALTGPIGVLTRGTFYLARYGANGNFDTEGWLPHPSTMKICGELARSCRGPNHYVGLHPNHTAESIYVHWKVDLLVGAEQSC